jgi:hypothetical protein
MIETSIDLLSNFSRCQVNINSIECNKLPDKRGLLEHYDIPQNMFHGLPCKTNRTATNLSVR